MVECSDTPTRSSGPQLVTVVMNGEPQMSTAEDVVASSDLSQTPLLCLRRPLAAQ
jgi:hypothetical protein